jgi:hypothetical protein
MHGCQGVRVGPTDLRGESASRFTQALQAEDTCTFAEGLLTGGTIHVPAVSSPPGNACFDISIASWPHVQPKGGVSPYLLPSGMRRRMTSSTAAAEHAGKCCGITFLCLSPAMKPRCGHLSGLPTCNPPTRRVRGGDRKDECRRRCLLGDVSTGVHTALRDPTLQIRLLRLHGGSKRHGISASLEVWDTGSEPRYRAISYVCGDAQRMQDITVNGRPTSVRHNCYYALWQASLHYPKSRVWIDALCINQLDLEEKTAQVMMMHEIYCNAAQVLACIGPSDSHSDVVKQAAEDPDTFVQKLPYRWVKNPVDLDLWNPPLDEASSVQFFAHYSEFYMRPYFSRVWILQELAGGHGRTLLLCGQKIWWWSDLRSLAKRLSAVHFHGPDGPYKVSFSNQIFNVSAFLVKEPQVEVEFPRCLSRLNSLHCQDIRDRIYSTRTLIDWSLFGQIPPVPDYRKSPVDLALQLVGMLVNTELRSVQIIAETLDLSNPSTISEVL